MFRHIAIATLFAGSLVGMAPPAMAHESALPSFRDLEYRADASDVLQTARTRLSARIPSGTTVADAESILHKAGARCRPSQQPAIVRCRYEQFEATEERLRDVSWTIDLAIDGDTVSALSVNRSSTDS